MASWTKELVNTSLIPYCRLIRPRCESPHWVEPAFIETGKEERIASNTKRPITQRLKDVVKFLRVALRHLS